MKLHPKSHRPSSENPSNSHEKPPLEWLVGEVQKFSRNVAALALRGLPELEVPVGVGLEGTELELSLRALMARKVLCRLPRGGSK